MLQSSQPTDPGHRDLRRPDRWTGRHQAGRDSLRPHPTGRSPDSGRSHGARAASHDPSNGRSEGSRGDGGVCCRAQGRPARGSPTCIAVVPLGGTVRIRTLTSRRTSAASRRTPSTSCCRLAWTFWYSTMLRWNWPGGWRHAAGCSSMVIRSGRVRWEATTRKIYFDKLPRITRAHREFAAQCHPQTRVARGRRRGSSPEQG